MKTSFNIKISGQAGEGIKASGLILARALTRLGYSVFGYSEYPSLIRGGENTYQIYASINDVYSQIKPVDLFVALDQKTIINHQSEMNEKTIILYNKAKFSLPKISLAGQYVPINFTQIALKAGGSPIMGNVVSLGVVLTLFNLPLITLKQAIAKEFSDKVAKITEINHKMAEAGQTYINNHHQKLKINVALPNTKKKRLIITGNEALALGAIAGGLQFFSAYPMTPTTSILHFLAQEAKEMGIFVKHVEDEISAINMALGAAFAGVRSMVATSGSGLCLMAEGITLAGITELPVVVVNGMRPGPAAGMPTWTGQGDLQFVLHLGHDDFSRVVLAPGDVQEAFSLTRWALNAAEKYQLPIIILSDKYLAESDYSLSPFKSIYENDRFSFANKPSADFKRYLLTSNGLSLRSIPGQKNGLYCCNSYEHDEYGLATEDSQTRTKMMKKRLSKENLVINNLPLQPTFGAKKGKLGLISFGSNKGPILEALKTLPNIGYLHLNCLWPFPKNQVIKFMNQFEKLICLEGNATGQLANLLKEQTAITLEKYLKYDGRPFYPEEIVEKLAQFG